MTRLAVGALIATLVAGCGGAAKPVPRAATATATASPADPGEPIAVGDEDSVWVAPSEAATVVELDARTGSERGRVEIGEGAADPKLALTDGAVWATVTPSGEVVRIDSDSRRVTRGWPPGATRAA